MITPITLSLLSDITKFRDCQLLYQLANIIDQYWPITEVSILVFMLSNMQR